MPDNNEVQGAAIDHRFIPAPVVPSDERCEDCETLSGMDDDGRFVMCEQHAREFTAPPTPSQDAEGDGLGRIVRETWVEWAREQPDVAEHPSWLVPWTELSERDKDVDRRIGAAIESAIRAPYEELVKARGWSARVEYDGQFALVIEWPGEPPYGRYWWVLCPAAATLHDDPPSEDEDPTEHDHGACSLSPECDFNELHALAHQAIRDRAAALESLGGRSNG